MDGNQKFFTIEAHYYTEETTGNDITNSINETSEDKIIIFKNTNRDEKERIYNINNNISPKKIEFTMDPTGEHENKKRRTRYESENMEIKNIIAMKSLETLKLSQRDHEELNKGADFTPIHIFKKRRNETYQCNELNQKIQEIQKKYPNPELNKSAFEKITKDKKNKKVLINTTSYDENGNLIRDESKNIKYEEKKISIKKAIKTNLKSGKKDIQNEEFEVLSFNVFDVIYNTYINSAFYIDKKTFNVGEQLIDESNTRTKEQYQEDLKNTLLEVEKYHNSLNLDNSNPLGINIEIKNNSGEIQKLTFFDLDILYDFLKIPGKEMKKVNIIQENSINDNDSETDIEDSIEENPKSENEEIENQKNSDQEKLNEKNIKFQLNFLEKIIGFIYELILLIFGKQKEFNETNEKKDLNILKDSFINPKLKEKILFNNFVDFQNSKTKSSLI